ncbi:MAG TPA: 5-formyltetrahydrofolate cyclo-ligase [Rhabdaerophilum sp.]|nr:5-formyltetrahydrofolate cyclo-ligase [Rhabdaerophilum sp.]
MDALQHEKKALRRIMKAQRDALPPEARARAVVRLTETGAPMLADRRAVAGATIAGYMPFRSEIDPLPLMRALAGAGARLALPRMEGQHLVLHAFAFDDGLVVGPYGILEPSAGARVVTPDIILTPLLAFDAKGGRLGYGKGFYDRLFAAHPEALRIGLAFREQRVETVPRAPHDAPLHLVLTGE